MVDLVKSAINAIRAGQITDLAMRFGDENDSNTLEWSEVASLVELNKDELRVFLGEKNFDKVVDLIKSEPCSASFSEKEFKAKVKELLDSDEVSSEKFKDFDPDSHAKTKGFHTIQLPYAKAEPAKTIIATPVPVAEAEALKATEVTPSVTVSPVRDI